VTALAAEPIPGDGLVLEPLRVEHAGEIAQVLADPSLHAFIGGRPQTPAELRARYERLVAGWGDPAVGWLNWVVRLGPSAPLAGTVQATVRERSGAREAEVAWVVGARWQGRGIGRRAAEALVGWLAGHGVELVTAHIHPEHAASAAVARHAGLHPTAQTRDGETPWELRPAPGRARRARGGALVRRLLRRRLARRRDGDPARAHAGGGRLPRRRARPGGPARRCSTSPVVTAATPSCSPAEASPSPAST
jgi:RimJ/RimL family protein N-acetyltransferase